MNYFKRAIILILMPVLLTVGKISAGVEIDCMYCSGSKNCSQCQQMLTLTMTCCDEFNTVVAPLIAENLTHSLFDCSCTYEQSESIVLRSYSVLNVSQLVSGLATTLFLDSSFNIPTLLDSYALYTNHQYLGSPLFILYSSLRL